MADAEMARTFNCGIGMMLVTAPDAAKAVTAVLTSAGENGLRDRPNRAAPRRRTCRHGRSHGRGMERLKLAILISGRGSNMQTLIDGCRKKTGEPGSISADINLVLANRADAAGLDRAKAAGLPTQVISHRDYPDRAAFDAALDGALARGRCEFRLPGRDSCAC